MTDRPGGQPLNVAPEATTARGNGPEETESQPRICIRRARSGEAGALSVLAMRSKAHWGYDDAFLAQVRGVLTLSESDLQQDEVYVLDTNRELAGFYRLIGDPPKVSSRISGSLPSGSAAAPGGCCSNTPGRPQSDRGFSSFLVESDPNAQGFYLAMGATRLGDRVSPAERSLPLLRISTSECADRAVLADNANDASSRDPDLASLSHLRETSPR